MASLSCLSPKYVHMLQVILAPIKTIARMLEKINKYRPPVYPSHRCLWPLAANVLDPVRLTLVCEHLLMHACMQMRIDVPPLFSTPLGSLWCAASTFM